jgi:uncharacterized protein (DUF1800 family)
MKPPAHLAPYLPGKDGPWDAAAAAHLLRRAGFGAAPEEVERAVKQGLDAAAAALFDEDRGQEAEFQQTFQRICGTLVDFGDAAQLQAWWCYRMRQTRTPLREKLTLFWHGHFATSASKVEDLHLMHRQCETLRRLAWGEFRELVLAVSRDPAMLVYLDGESNSKEHPNENYARELMELFTVGIGQYTEKDVQEAARAFTGWHRDGAKFVFDAEAHDAGPKQFLGKRGPLDGTDVLDALLEHPALPRSLARKLLLFFACPEPPDAVIEEAADLLGRSRLNVRTFLTTLFTSKFFYSRACRRTRIASPAELVIGTARSLGLRLAAPELRDNLTAMGQELYAPPNVKGWDGEKKWINATTWAARQAFAKRVAELESDGEFGPNLDVGKLVPEEMNDPDKVAGVLVDRLLDGELPPAKRADVAKFLRTGADGEKPEQFREDAEFRTQQVRAAVAVLLSLPEYHTY